MNSNKLETREDFDYRTTSVASSMVTGSSASSSPLASYQNQDIKNRGETEVKMKVKKSRSIKLVRSPSLRLAKFRVLSSDAACSQQSTQMEMLDASPNYTKNTTSSDAKKEKPQKLARTFSRRSGFRPAKSLARLPSTNFRRPSMRRSSRADTDIKKKLKKLRSIKLANRPLMGLSVDEDIAVDYFKATSCSDVGDHNHQASGTTNIISKWKKNDENGNNLNPDLANKSLRFITRTASLRPVRILMKTPMLKGQKPSITRCPKTSDSSIRKNTCSSALKDSNFPDYLQFQPGGTEAEGISALKVCPYTYCSLHGHRHRDSQQLDHIGSTWRPMLKKQKSRRASGRAKLSSNTKGRNQRSQTAFSADAAVLETDHDRRAMSSIRHEAGQEEGINVEAYKVDSESNTREANTSINELQDTSKSLITDRLIKSIAISNVASCASVSDGEQAEDQIVAREETNEHSVQDYPIKTNSELYYTTNAAQESQRERQKHMGLWHLIYQHMSAGIGVEDEIQPPPDKADEEEKMQDANTLPVMNKTDSFPDSNEGARDYGDGSQLYQHDVIKLVQEAFDKILSEIPDQSSDVQSITSDTTSEKELTEKNHDECGELIVSASSESVTDNIVQDQEEIRCKSDVIHASTSEKPESKLRNDSDQQTPKSWSYVKKVFILKRFVKALEKARNINPRTPQHLPVKSDPETEKVRLRRQTVEDRKNSEEWMLDYALQHVISKLDPAQKRKVALLVQAFETVVLPPRTHANQSSDLAASRPSAHQSYAGSSYKKGSGKGKETNAGIFCRERPSPEMSQKVSDIGKAAKPIPVFCSAIIEETSLESSFTLTAADVSDSDSTATGAKEEAVSFSPYNGDNNSIVNDHQLDFVKPSSAELATPNLSNESSSQLADVMRAPHKFLITGEVVKEISKESSADSSSDVYNLDFPVNGQNLDSNNQINAKGEPKAQSTKSYKQSAATNNLLSSAFSKLLEDSSEQEKSELESNFKESEASCSSGVALEKQLEKKKHMRLWYLVYKHMSGRKALLEEAVKEEPGDDVNILTETKKQGLPVTNMEDQIAGGENIELQKIEAIKLVEEAIDEIQDDSSDDQSVNSYIVPDQNHLEKELSISTSEDKTNEESNCTEADQHTTLDSEEPWLNSDNIIAQEIATAESKEKLKLQPPMRKNWNNIKKLILLKRFIKALGKVKKFNPQEPRLLPLDPEKEAERVDLRHQDTEDRKNSEEWMLDYALQQVVAKLTPARKRKVELLVQAFETVIPTMGS